MDSLRLPPEQETRASSDEEERRSVRSERSPQRTLIIPSAVPGRTIEIPLGDAAMQRSFSQSWNPEPPRPSVPKSESQLERLTQRLRTLGKFSNSLSSGSPPRSTRIRGDAHLQFASFCPPPIPIASPPAILPIDSPIRESRRLCKAKTREGTREPIVSGGWFETLSKM